MRGSASQIPSDTDWTSSAARPSWDDFTLTREDIRQRYNEQRLVTFGRLNGQVVVVVYTERRGGPHIISLRKAEKYEARYYIAEAEGFQGQD
jgi:uncharacterized DUF497 family protein